MTKKVCKIEECDIESETRGLCHKHYARFYYQGRVDEIADKKGKHPAPKSAFKKGHKAWNKGTKGIMTPWNRGIKTGVTAWNKGIKWDAMVGKNNPNWKGGLCSENYKDRRKFRKNYQQSIFERDDYTCQICDHRGGNLQVDHIKSWSEHSELRFEPDNCRTLCMACHYYITFKKQLPKGLVWGHNFNRAKAGITS